MTLVIVVILLLAYILIATESVTNVNKAAVASYFIIRVKAYLFKPACVKGDIPRLIEYAAFGNLYAGK